MVGWGLLVNTGLGLLYGPISMLTLQVLYILFRTVKGGPNNDDLATVVSTTDPGTLFVVLVLSVIIGIADGALIGFFASMIAGTIIVTLFRFFGHRLLEMSDYHNIINMISAVISGCVALALTALLNMPAILSYLGYDWVVLGWVVWIAVPTILVSVSGWWASNRVVRYLEDQ
jgi:hypothetical protein